MDSLTQDLADLIPVSEKLKKENDEFKLEIESLKQTIEEGENERIQMLRNDILFSFLLDILKNVFICPAIKMSLRTLTIKTIQPIHTVKI